MATMGSDALNEAVGAAGVLAQLDALAEGGQLRRLGAAFARFIGTLGSSSASVAASPLLVAAALLSELEGRGHSCLLLDDLVRDPRALMGWTDEQWLAVRSAATAAAPWPKTVAAWTALLAGCDQVWRVGDLDFQQPLVLDGARLYLRRYWRDETLVALAVRTRAQAQQAPDPLLARRWLDLLFPARDGDSGDSGGEPDWQKLACAVALRGKLAIITGGPGTGKTYTVARLLALLFASVGDKAGSLRIALAAPTGKAAARLKQSIDNALGELATLLGAALPLRELAQRMGAARTLHSLLGARPDTRSFQHHHGNRLDVDVLIVDEASMVHLEMMASLLDALPPHATLILLGDKDQLASVEAGAVLGDLCHDAVAGNYSAATQAYVQAATGQRLPNAYLGNGGALAQQTVMLRRSHRFGGPIGALALAVNGGDAAAAHAVLRAADGAELAWLQAAQPADVHALAQSGRAGAGDGYAPYLELIAAGVHAVLDGETDVGKGGTPHERWVGAVLKRFEAFRILCAVRDGEWGVTGLNEAIEQRLERAGLIRRRGAWYVGRPVMVTRNDYGMGVFNGDIGLTLPDPLRPGSLRVYFSEGGTVRSVLATRLRQVETAFAMTVHKSQGSEFRHTVLALPREGGTTLARELVYTGITRASKRFTLVTPEAIVLERAIVARTQRASGLRGLLD